jgi:galactose mutarotase-like enzyme
MVNFVKLDQFFYRHIRLTYKIGMEVALENDYLKVKISPKGAELNSVISKSTLLEYMWSGDPAVWGKTSPVLFPIVGALKKDMYLYHDKSYSLSRHGFGRDSYFEIGEQGPEEAIFSLASTPESLEMYPFKFQFLLTYRLVKDFLELTSHVENTGDTILYFSVRGHPAFKVPMTRNSTYEEHYLQFNRVENADRWPVSQEGLIKDQPTSFLRNSAIIKLNKSLFDEDALVFKKLKSDAISIKSEVHDHGLDFYFGGFPYLGIWAAKNADFVCIEPWCGIADSITHDQQLVTKEGIVTILPNEFWSRAWKVRFY